MMVTIMTINEDDHNHTKDTNNNDEETKYKELNFKSN